MMASHSVNLSELASFIDDMASFDATAEKHLRDLDRQVSRLHGMWEGAARTPTGQPTPNCWPASSRCVRP